MKPIYFPEKVPFSLGGHMCDRCDTVLTLQDFRGYYEGTVFHVRGYLCPSCGGLAHNTTVKSSGIVPFDWRRMPVSRVPVRGLLGESG